MEKMVSAVHGRDETFAPPTVSFSSRLRRTSADFSFSEDDTALHYNLLVGYSPYLLFNSIDPALGRAGYADERQWPNDSNSSVGFNSVYL